MGELIYRLNDIKYENKTEIVNALREYTESKGFIAEYGQIAAWEACIDFLIGQSNILLKKNISTDIPCIFEYFLPLEGGRRPDVIMLFEGKVIILEFKNKEDYKEDDILQAIGYREDIFNYHKYTRDNNLKVESYLVLAKGSLTDNVNSIQVLNKENFIEELNLTNLNPLDIKEANNFSNSPYEPLPDILSATYNLFKTGKLPHIQNIEDGDIEKAYKQLKKIVFHNIEKNQGKNIIFISGVPGAGKTLVALKFLYNYNKYIKSISPKEEGSIYLSGNGPLVNVIEAQIDSALGRSGLGKAYIKGALPFKKDFMENSKIPNYNVILFDEAQRAWDEEKMKAGGISEPQALLDICNKIYSSKGNVNLVCFVGNGQSIHEGEEEGLKLWVDALKNNGDYNIYIPNEFRDEFKGFKSTNCVKDLHLDVSIRNNFIDISNFVEDVLSCDVKCAKNELELIKSKGFVIKVSRDFEKCKNYVSGTENRNLKYGMLISSKANSYDMKRILNNNNFTSYIDSKKSGKWFLEECTKMEVAASEFACQGLEIDVPVVIFGGDYYIDKGKFMFDSNKLKKKIENYRHPETIIESIYRVLLTRSRKGMAIFVPEYSYLDETYKFFIDIGIEEI